VREYQFFEAITEKQINHLRLTIKFKANVETAPRQPFDTY
jgi:hypothetical protein